MRQVKTPRLKTYMQNYLGNCRDTKFPLRQTGQEGQVQSPYLRQASGQHAQRGRGRPHHHHGPSCEVETENSYSTAYELKYQF